MGGKTMERNGGLMTAKAKYTAMKERDDFK
jgi:hypothetical protein